MGWMEQQMCIMLSSFLYSKQPPPYSGRWSFYKYGMNNITSLFFMGGFGNPFMHLLSFMQGDLLL